MDRDELMLSIRQALGVRLSGTAATISHEGTRRLVGALEMLSDEQLSAIHVVILKAVEANVKAPWNSWHEYHSTPSMCSDDCLGEDILRIRHYIRRDYLKEVYALATVIDLIPDGMAIRDAHEALSGVLIEQFSVDTPERVLAHLHVCNELAKDKTGYSPAMMLLVHVHPDKAKTIAALAVRNSNTPTHAEVLAFHGVEPVLHDGVL